MTYECFEFESFNGVIHNLIMNRIVLDLWSSPLFSPAMNIFALHLKLPEKT